MFKQGLFILILFGHMYFMIRFKFVDYITCKKFLMKACLKNRLALKGNFLKKFPKANEQKHLLQ